MKTGLILGVALSGAITVPGVAMARDTITAATWLPPQHQYSRYLYNYWAEALEKQSGGTLTAEVELGSARVTPTGNLSEIADGLADVSGHFAQYTPSDLPVANALEELGMTFGDPRVVIAAATEFNMNEQYGALDKGALTCTTTTAADAYIRKLYEVAPHVTDMPITMFWAGLGHGYNPAVWAELTEDQRKAAFYAEADAMAALIVDGTLLEEVAAEENLKAEGVTFHEPGEDLAGSIAAFRAAQPDNAVPIIQEKYKIQEAEALLARFQATIDKWDALLADVPVEDVAALADLMRTEIYDKIDLSTYDL